jgi:hypothetical protein
MPIDPSGLFTRAYDWVTDRANGIKIIAARMDGEFNNYADGLNTAFWRTGIVAMTGNFKAGGWRILDLAAGGLAQCSLSFNNDPSTGLYSSAVGKLSGSANGVIVFDFSATQSALAAANNLVFVASATDTFLLVGGTNILHGVVGTTSIFSTTGVGVTFDATGMTFNSVPKIFGNPAWDIAALLSSTTSGVNSLDFKLFVNIKITLNGALTLSNPTSVTIGQSGTICLKQDGVGSRSVSWGTMYKWPGGTVPSLSTAANAEDEFAYYIESASVIKMVLVGKAYA